MDVATPDTATEASLPHAKRPIFFVHIPKTGGNTIVSHFLAFLPVAEVYPPPPQLTLLDEDCAVVRDRLAGLRFVHGHVRAAMHRSLPLDAMRLVTFIRHPVRLVASHYLYAKHMPTLPLHHAAKSLSIAEFLRHYPSIGTNPQTRYLTEAFGMRMSGTVNEGSDPATSPLDRFDFVGVTERMQDSLDALSEHYGIPTFPAGRHNEGRASRDEVEACEAMLRRDDEWLQRLGADFTLRRKAEDRLNRWQAARRAARAADTLLGGLRGLRPMPWVLARQEDAALTFLDGWHAQGWVGEPRPDNGYWWTTDSARILVASASGRPLRVRMHVLETMGFDAATIRVSINGERQETEAVLADPGVEVSFRLTAEMLARHRNAVVVQVAGPRSSTFALIDPATGDHQRRSFAARGLSIAFDDA